MSAFPVKKQKVRLKPGGIAPTHDWYSLLNQVGTILEVERQSWLFDVNKGKKDKNKNPLPPNYIPAYHDMPAINGLGKPNGFVTVQFDTVTGKRTIHAPVTSFEPLK